MTAPSEAGHLSANVSNRSLVFQAIFPRILSASRTNGINQIPRFTIIIPASDPNVAVLEPGYFIGLDREGEGRLFTGLIGDVKTIVSSSGGPVTEITGFMFSIELVWDSTYDNEPLVGVTPSAALTTLLANLESAWTVVAPSTPLITTRFANQTVHQAALAIAQMSGGYLRETSTTRQIELKTTHAASSIVLVNPEAIVPELEGSTTVGIVKSLKRSVVGNDIINRIVPTGLASEDQIYDLSQSSRSSPYTIGSLTPTIPSVARRQGFLEYMPGNNLHLVFPATHDVSGAVNGRNLLLMVFYASNDPAKGVTALRLGTDSTTGQAATLIGSYTAGATRRVDAFYFVRPPRNIAAMIATTNYTSAARPAGAVFGGVWLEDVDLIDILQGGTSSGSGTSIFPAVTKADMTTTDLAIIATIVVNFAAGFLYTLDTDFVLQVKPSQGLAVELVVGTTPGFAGVSEASILNQSRDWMALMFGAVGAKNYYIQDATSIAARGRRTLPMQAKHLNLSNFVSVVDAHNSLYDFAAAELARRKDPFTEYECEPLYLPRAGWLPGDTMRLWYAGEIEDEFGRRSYLDIDANLVVMEATDSYDESGRISWRLKLANVVRTLPDNAGVLANQAQQLSAISARV